MKSTPEPTKPLIRTPDQRLRVFVSSTLQELAEERAAAKAAIAKLRLIPVMFELGARPHPPRDLYRAYLAQSDIFVGIYWQRYGWVAPGETLSGLEDEYRLAGERPKLIYLKTPAEREPRLGDLLGRIRNDDQSSYRPFTSAAELGELIENDLALLLTEHFELSVAKAAPAEHALDNLPLPLTSLVGREQELEALGALLRRDEVRLVTLHGPGGVGKSRLALEAARGLLEDFTDGVVFVDLAPIQDPALVAATIARTLRLRESGDRPWLESLLTFLRDKNLLLLLDNFEQLITAAPLIAELLANCPRLKVLVTSRSLLRLSWEHGFPVPTLALPALRERPELEPLAQTAAVALFLARARSVKPDFALTLENAPVIAEICVRLDGLPLAIELAAARLRLLPPPALLGQLVRQTTLRFLKGGARDLPARQQTLYNAIAWSHELLDEGERQLFRRLAVFVGGFTLEAAEAVLGEAREALPNGSPEVMEGLASLIDESLLRDMALDKGGEPRFAMLGTIREYALGRLEASGETAALRRAHAGYFLKLAEAADRDRMGAQLEAEHDNLRAALAWYQEGEAEPGRALRLAVALITFWLDLGDLSEGRAWLEEVLARPAEAVTPVRAKALQGVGIIAWHQGDTAAARAHLEASIAAWRSLQDERSLAVSLNWLGQLLLEQVDRVQAHALFEESAAICERRGDKEGLAWALNLLGSSALHQGDLATARVRLERSLTLAQGNARIVMRTLHRLGDLSTLEGDRGGAQALYREVAALLEAGTRRQERLLVLHTLGWAVYRAGDSAWAKALLEESLSLAKKQGDRRQVAWALNHLGDVARCGGDDLEASALYEESLALFRAMAHRQGEAAVLHNLGYLALHRGEQKQAAALFRKSLELFGAVGHRWSVADSLAGLAALAAVEGRAERAARLFGTAEGVHGAIDSSGMQHDPANEAEWERYQETARAQLDEAVWSAARTAGRDMGLEEAVVYALTDRIP